ncbi:hypothetical protein VE03_09728 [Pseudogymnoascus sp. 23342-1-I1]|nr:hypothetical protein VE03_09728 [Pseudogymnoascus sp. 23342-1-I1]
MRHDEYGGTPDKRARVVLEIIRQTRAVVPKTFCIGVKLNSADHNASDFEDTMRQIELFAEIGVDFLEISGGTFENPTMMGRGLRDEMGNERNGRALSREGFFLDFATEARKRFPELILMLTGGFRSRKGAEAALQSGACDLVGIGRAAVVRPNLSQLMLENMYSDEEASVY